MGVAARSKQVQHNWYWLNRDRLVAYKRDWRKTHKEKCYNKSQPYDIKKAARRAVTYAISTGSLIPQPCEVCGEKAWAHHDDYTKPLEVRWLCPVHQKEFHDSVRRIINGQ